MNAPQNFLASGSARSGAITPPAGFRPEDALLLAGAVTGRNGAIFAQPSDPLYFDLARGVMINARSGEHTQVRELPMAGGRAGAGYQFTGGAPPSPQDVHYPTVLQGWLQRYQNAEYLLDRVVQQQSVDRSDFLHRDHSSTDTFLYRDTKASLLSAAAQVQPTTALSTRHTSPRRIAGPVPFLSEQEADYPLYEATARVCMNSMQLSREVDAFSTGGLFMTSTNWASAVRLALGATYNWGPPGSEGADSNPIRDLQNAWAASLGSISLWVMGYAQMTWFFQHPAVVDWFTRHNAQGVMRGIEAAINRNREAIYEEDALTFTVPQIGGTFLVHQARVTTDPATAPDFFWPSDIVLGFRLSPSMPPNNDVATAVTFVHRTPSAGSPAQIPGSSAATPMMSGGTMVRVIDLPLLGSGARLIVLDRNELTCFTSNNVGAYITGIS